MNDSAPGKPDDDSPDDAKQLASRAALDRRILALALPAIGSGLTALGHFLIDSFWVGRLGEKEVAALAVGSFAVWIFASLSSLVSVGVTALVARYRGAGRARAAAYVASQSLRATLVLSLIYALAGWLLAPLSYLGKDADVALEGVAYVRIIWVGGFAYQLQHAIDAVFRGNGNTRIPFVIACAGLALNFMLDPLLILGAGSFEGFGVAGAAFATVIAMTSSCGVSFVVARRMGLVSSRHPGDDALRLDDTTRLGRAAALGLDWAVFARLIRVGSPIALSGTVFSIIYIVVSDSVQAAGGSAAVAGLGVGHRGEAMAFVICGGYAAAASALVGQHLGARDAIGASRAAWRATLHCVVLCTIWALIITVFGRPFALLFVETDAALAHATAYYRIVAWSLAPQAVELVLEGAFGGAGLTLPPMCISVPITLLRIPLAMLAVELGHGAEGIWWVISLTAVARGLLTGLWFARGTWKTRSV